MKNKYLTIWLTIILILVFIMQLTFPITDSFLLNQKSFSEPWRFVTAIFLHGSLEHLIFNLFALVLFGLILESLIGSKRFIFTFFTAGIIANIISIFFYNSSLGASGAIFGIIGVLTIIKPFMLVWTYSLPMPMFLAAIFWASADLLGIFMPSNVGNIAHLTGLAIGLILGVYFRIKHFKHNKEKSNYSRISINENYMRDWEDRHLR